MDKKKIIGAAMFLVILTVYISFPRIQEWNFRRNLLNMISNEQYEEVNAIMEEVDFESLDTDYKLRLLKSKLDVGYIDGFSRITVGELAENNEISTLQGLVDEYGMRLDYLLILIESLDGINIPEEMVPELAEMLYNNGIIDRAMALGYEVEEVSNQHIFHLRETEDIETLLKLYDKVPHHLKRNYYDVIGFHLTYWKTVSMTPGRQGEYLDFLDSLDYPESVLRHIGMNFARDHLPETVKSHPFIKNNIYVEFYRAVDLIKDPATKGQGLQKLESGDFSEINGIEKVIEIAEKGTMLGYIGGVTHGLMYHQGTVYNLQDGRIFDKDKQLALNSVSPDRNYFVASAFLESEKDVILNSSFEVIDEIGVINLEYWINESSFVFRAFNPGDIEKKEVYNIDTKEVSDYQGEEPYLKDFKPAKEGALIWSINDERYTSIEPVDPTDPYFYTNIRMPGYKKYYTVRDRETHREIYKMPFDFQFYDSCDNYIYGLDLKEEFIQILVKLDKETGEIIELPFYTLDQTFWYGPLFNYLPISE